MVGNDNTIGGGEGKKGSAANKDKEAGGINVEKFDKKTQNKRSSMSHLGYTKLE